MPVSHSFRPLRTARLLATAAILSATAPAATPSGNRPYAAFAKENDAAMNKMMVDMDVKPIGDVDVDFVAMMIPHHQGGIDMARALLRYSRNAKLRQIAQGIVVQQEKEIALMRASVARPIPRAAPRALQHHKMH